MTKKDDNKPTQEVEQEKGWEQELLDLAYEYDLFMNISNPIIASTQAQKYHLEQKKIVEQAILAERRRVVGILRIEAAVVESTAFEYDTDYTKGQEDLLDRIFKALESTDL